MRRWIALILTAGMCMLVLCGCEASSVVPPYLTLREQDANESIEWWGSLEAALDNREFGYREYREWEVDGRVGEILQEVFGISTDGEVIRLDDARAKRVEAVQDRILSYLYHYDYVNDNAANLRTASTVMTPALAEAIRSDGYYDRLFSAADTYHVRHLMDLVDWHSPWFLIGADEQNGVRRYLYWTRPITTMCSFDGGFCALYPWKEAGNSEQYELFFVLRDEADGGFLVEGWIQSALNFNWESKGYTIFSENGVEEIYIDNRDDPLWDHLRDMKLEERNPNLSAEQLYHFGNLVDEVFRTWYVVHPGEDKEGQYAALLGHMREDRRTELEDSGELDMHRDYMNRESTDLYIQDEDMTTAHMGMFVDRYSKDDTNYYWCKMYAFVIYDGDADVMEYFRLREDVLTQINIYVLLEEQADGNCVIVDWGHEKEAEIG